MHFHSLRQRFFVLLLAPVFLLLSLAGLVGFWQIHDHLLEQWRTSARFSLEEAAHAVDMRLARPDETLRVVAALEGGRELAASEWQELLAKVPGVARARVTAADAAAGPPAGADMGAASGRGVGMEGHGGGSRAGGMMCLGRVAPARLEGPRLDAEAGRSLVTLTYAVLGENSQPAGRVELDMSFDFFLEDLKALSWWQSTQVLLVADDGAILASHGYDPPRQGRLGGDGDPLEQAVLADFARGAAGTLLSGHPARRVLGFHRLKRAPWLLVLSAPGDRVLGPVFGFLASFSTAAVIAVILVSLLILAVTGGVVRRVTIISRATGRVAGGDYEELPPEACRDEVGQLAQGFNHMLAGLRERDYIRDTFGRYVDEGVAKKLMARPEARRLGGEARVVAILMTDVRGFTQVSAGLGPEQTIQLVNRYLEGIIAAIGDHRGIIVDFLGDAALAFFDSLDSTPEEAARQALCCALAARKASDEFNRQAEAEGLPRLETAIALNAGQVVVGNIGSRARTKFGIVGGPVNLTQRIETQAEAGEILASRDFVDLCGDFAQVARRFTATLKGVAGPVELCVLQADDRCDRVAGGGPPMDAA